MSQSLDNFQLYQKFNQLIESPQIPDENLLDEISRLKRSVVLSQRVKDDFEDAFGQGQGHYDLQQIQKCLDILIIDQTDTQGLLVGAENGFFREMIQLRSDVSGLEEDIKKQHFKRDELKKILSLMKKDPEMILNTQLKNHRELIFKESDFEKVKEEIKQIQIKIETIQLVDENIEAKIEVAKSKNQELQKQKLNLLNELNERRQLLKEKKSLLERSNIEQEERKIQAISEKVQSQKKLANEMIEMLKQRLELQFQMEQQQTEKDQFLSLLVTFKSKFDETQKKYKILKEKMKEKGMNLIEQQRKSQ